MSDEECGHQLLLNKPYKNKKNKKNAVIIEARNGHVRIKYVITCYETWYPEERFKKMFQLVE